MRTDTQIASKIVVRYVCALSALFISLEVEEGMVMTGSKLHFGLIAYFPPKIIVLQFTLRNRTERKTKIAFHFGS